MKRVPVVLIALALVLVGCAGQAATTTLSPTTTASAVTATGAASTETTLEATSASSDENTTTSEETTTTTVSVVTWGTPAEVDGLRITVSKPFTNTSLQVRSGLQVDKTQKVVMVKVTIENIGARVADYDATEFTLYDTVNSGPDPGNALGADLAPDTPRLEPSGAPGGNFSVDLEPGKTAVGYVTFILPSTAAATRVEYDAFSSLVGADAIWQ